jgi:hypothetical protein
LVQIHGVPHILRKLHDRNQTGKGVPHAICATPNPSGAALLRAGEMSIPRSLIRYYYRARLHIRFVYRPPRLRDPTW